jgi:hypothetical protein
MQSIESILMQRDGITEKQAIKQVQAIKRKFDRLIAKGQMMQAYDVLDSIGLEPDYLEQLH